MARIRMCVPVCPGSRSRYQHARPGRRSFTIWLLSLALLPLLALAAEDPDWAYPVAPPPSKPDNVILKSVPGSTRQYTQAQIDDPYNPPDWFPDEHPPMPEIAARGGQKPAGRACAQCHLPTGDGHPESSSLAGLPADYIIRQMAAFRDGDRKGVRAIVMIAMAKVLSEAEVKAAADYYAGLKPGAGYNKVVETGTVAKSYVGAGGMRFAAPDGATEPIGRRIIVLPHDETRARLRDPKSGFIDYVPVGSIARGAALAAGGDGKTTACASCHGPDQKGFGEAPGITARPATYIFRQLNDMKKGNRNGPQVELMKAVVEKLNDDDMIALAAYLGSLAP
jgi:cytochrome c553